MKNELDDNLSRFVQPLIHDNGLDLLLEYIGNAQVVLLGEASHGTHEFYQTRAAITRRLIAERGFTIVAVEADWPDAYRVNCFAQGATEDTTPEQALGNFERFPRWMWRNTIVRDFVTWLREYNAASPDASSCGFYGIDLYSLHSSIHEVITYLEHTDPEAAQRARSRYGCFEDLGRDPQRYGYSASFGGDTCEDEVVAQLVELQHSAVQTAQRDGRMGEDERFYAEQNARLVANAERYYRAMFHGRDESWNLRDTHMADTLDALIEHIGRQGRAPKAVVWAHNSHLGDARATEMGRYGELNVGQITRQRHGDRVYSVGFTTYSGTVTAAHDWDEPPQRMAIRPGLADSYEALFHETGSPRFLLDLHEPALSTALGERLERAIGVIYRPATERQSHYFRADLSKQFDAVIHIDETHALQPLDRDGGWEDGELPETYPFGQ